MRRIIFCFLVCVCVLFFPRFVLGLSITSPLPNNLAELDDTRDGIIFAWQSDFVPKDDEFIFELWQVDKDGNKIVVIVETVTKPMFSLDTALLAGGYCWQVLATTDDGVKIISPVWQFYCEPWFDIFVEKSALLLLTRFPGEFTMKWTKIMLASNANIRLVFKEIVLVDEHNNVLPAVFGLKQGKNPVVWQVGQWQMFFEKPLQAEEFELWLKITADAQVSAGDYRGIIKGHILIEE